MKAGRLTLAVLAALGMMLSACGEDPLDNPDDMVTLNMMDEDHGRTCMGESDIYITRDHNFATSDYYLCDFGPVLDLGHIEEDSPDLGTLTNQAAVAPDEGYLAFRRSDCQVFPSGHPAVAIGTSYYRIWIDEWIKENKVRVGAKVNFALFRPQDYELPTWGSDAGTIDASNSELTIRLGDPKRRGCEAMLDSAASGRLTVATETISKRQYLIRVSLTPIATAASAAGRYTLYLRTGNSYTLTTVYVKG